MKLFSTPDLQMMDFLQIVDSTDISDMEEWCGSIFIHEYLQFTTKIAFNSIEFWM